MFLTITFLLWNKHWNNSTSQKEKCQYTKNSGKKFTLIYGWSPALIFRVNKMLIDFLNIIMIWICYFINDFRSDKKEKKRDLTILWILDTFLSTGIYKMYLPFIHCNWQDTPLLIRNEYTINRWYFECTSIWTSII